MPDGTPITLQVTMTDYHGKGGGKYSLKFEAPRNRADNTSQMIEALRCAWLDNNQCVLLTKINGETAQLAVAVLDGFHQEKFHLGGGFVIPFISDIDSVELQNILELAKETVGTDAAHQRSFELNILTHDDVVEIKKRKAERERRLKAGENPDVIAAEEAAAEQFTEVELEESEEDIAIQ